MEQDRTESTTQSRPEADAVPEQLIENTLLVGEGSPVVEGERVEHTFTIEDGDDITEVSEEQARELGFPFPELTDETASEQTSATTTPNTPEEGPALDKVRTTKVEVVETPEGTFIVSTIEGYYDMVVKEEKMVKKESDGEGDKEEWVKNVTPRVYRLRRKSVKWRPAALGAHGLPISIQPTQRALIRPSRAKPANRQHKIIYVAGDEQIGYRNIDGTLMPMHDEKAMAASQQFLRYLNPDTVVNTGDTTDFAELSTHQPDAGHYYGTIQPALNRTHEYFAEQTANSPNAETRAAVDSNHVERMVKFIMRKAPELWGVRSVGDKYPAFSYPGLIKLDEIGWQWVDGYGAAEYEYAEDLAFIHGTMSKSNGSTAAELSKKNYGRNIVQGHAHRMETQYHSDRKGRVFGAFVVGALCRMDGAVPGYYSAVNDATNQPVKSFEHNWQQGVMVIHDYGQGQYQFDHVPIHDGVLHYNGKTFDGTEGRTITYIDNKK